MKKTRIEEYARGTDFMRKDSEQPLFYRNAREIDWDAVREGEGGERERRERERERPETWSRKFVISRLKSDRRKSGYATTWSSRNDDAP